MFGLRAKLSDVNVYLIVIQQIGARSKEITLGIHTFFWNQFAPFQLD